MYRFQIFFLSWCMYQQAIRRPHLYEVCERKIGGKQLFKRPSINMRLLESCNHLQILCYCLQSKCMYFMGFICGKRPWLAFVPEAEQMSNMMPCTVFKCKHAIKLSHRTAKNFAKIVIVSHSFIAGFIEHILS